MQSVELQENDLLLAQQIASDPDLIKSYDENQTRPYIGSVYYDGMDPQMITETFEREALEEVEGFEFSAIPFFLPRAEIHRENIRYFNSHHWSDRDEWNILQEHRKPYKIPEIRAYFTTLLGEQRAQRTDLRGIPKTRFVEDKVEGINHFFKWFQQVNRFHSINSDVFRDGVIGGVGAAGCMLDYNNPSARVSYKKYYPLQFMWDIPSAEDALLTNTKYLWRGSNVSLSSAIDEFPQCEESIRDYSGFQGDRYLFDLQTMIQPMIHAPANRLVGSTTFNPTLYRQFRDYVFKREFFRRRYERRLCVRDGISDTSWYFRLDDIQGATDCANKVYQFYMTPSVQERYGIQQPLVSKPYEQNAAYVDKLTFIGQKLVSIQTVQTDKLPYMFYIPDWYDGELTSYFEHGKDIQRYLNRVMMYQDQRMSGVKGITIVNKALVDEKWTEDRIRHEIAQPNPVIVGDWDPSMDVRALITNIAPPQDSGQMREMRETMSAGMGQLFGGPNIIGQEAFAGQSGKSAQSLYSAATTRTIPLYDKFRDFQRQVGEFALTLLPHLDKTVQMAIESEYGEVQFATMIDLGLQNPEDYDFMVDVDQVVSSPTEQAASLQRLTIVAQTNEQFANAAAPLMLDDMDLDASKKRRFLQSLQQQQEAQSALAEHEKQVEIATMLLKERTEQHTYEVRMRELDIQEKNMAKISLGGKLDGSISPALLATLLDQSGHPAEPLPIAADYAQHEVYKTQIDGMNMDNYNAHIPEWERKAIENKVAVKKKVGVDTPKDRMARSKKKVNKG